MKADTNYPSNTLLRSIIQSGITRYLFVILLLSLITFSSSLHAATLVIDREITGIVHHYTPPNTLFGQPGSVNDEILFDTTGLSGLDLSQYDSFKLRLHAPNGQKLVADHSGDYGFWLNIYYQAGSDSGSHAEPATLEFEQFAGTMPSNSYSLFYVGDEGNVLRFRASEEFADEIEFTALSYAFTASYNPTNTAKNFVQGSSTSLPISFYYQTEATNDPGAFISLVAIPPQTLVIDREITGIVHHYTPPNTLFGQPGSVNDEILFDTTGLSGLDLSQYDSFKLRLHAPNGQKLVADHSGDYGFGLSVYYLAGGDSSSHTEPATLEFEQFAGTMPSNSYSLFYVGDGGNVLQFQASQDFTGGAEFTALSYAFTASYNPTNNAKDFVQGSSSGWPISFYYQTEATNDPGTFLTMGNVVPLSLGITNVVSGQGFIDWVTLSNQHYQIQIATNLTAASPWVDYGDIIVGEGGIYSFEDTNTLWGSKFYRVLVLPQSR